MINIFCALPAEAEAIVQHYQLNELKQFGLYRLYQSRDKKINLTITGIGKLNAAAAVSYHHACLASCAADIWLNIGVAGHADIAIGEARLVHKIVDKQNAACWYPQILFDTSCKSAPLISLNNPSTDYTTDLYDMEAAGFYQMAIRIGTAELIHCLKIISDNRCTPTTTVNADRVKKLIAAHITTIDAIIDALLPLADEVASINSESEHYQAFIKQWHFTQSERIQLLRLLRCWSLRRPDQCIMQSIAALKTGKQVLTALQKITTDTNFVIHD